MRQSHVRLLGAGALAIGAAALVAVDAPLEVKALPVLGLTLFAPGYTMAGALFGSGALRVPERLVVTIAGSVACIIAVGLILQLTPGGLDREATAFALAGLTALFAVIAAFRERGLERPTPRPGVILSRTETALALLAVVIAGGAIYVAKEGALEGDRPDFTQLGMNRTPDGSVRMTIQSHESHRVRYSLRLTGSSDARSKRYWPVVDLAPNESWTTTVRVPPGAIARLYRSDMPGRVYRQTTLTSQ